VITVENLSRIYKRRAGLTSRKVATRALDGVDLEVRQGEILCVVGESGSGKSTLLRCIAALDQLDQGAVWYGGRAISRLNRSDLKEFRREVQLVLQNPRTAFNPMLTVGTSVMENVPQKRDHRERRDKAIRALTQVGIHSSFFDRLPAELSGGELQRASIARALCSEPKVMLLDEPTSALDLSIRGQIVRLLLDLQTRKGFSLLISTHDLALAESIADRVVVLYRGQVVEVAQAESLFATPLHPYSFGLLTSRHATQGEVNGVLLDSADTIQLPPQACRLIPRCPFTENSCHEEQTLVPYTVNHFSRCWKSQDWKSTGNGAKI
jgi:oligopeptide/dipeptide ABC transporter ATP-binding protein